MFRTVKTTAALLALAGTLAAAVPASTAANAMPRGPVFQTEAAVATVGFRRFGRFHRLSRGRRARRHFRRRPRFHRRWRPRFGLKARLPRCYKYWHLFQVTHNIHWKFVYQQCLDLPPWTP